MSLTARDCLVALRHWLDSQDRGYGSARWLFFEELEVHPQGGHRRLDAYAIDCWGGGSRRIAYEVKVSRSDVLRELRRPEKRKQALLVASQYYFVCPKGLVQKAEIPFEAGLIEIDEQGKCRTVVEAPTLPSFPPSWTFLASLARRAWERRDALLLAGQAL